LPSLAARAARWELFRKQRVSTRLLLPVLVELVVGLLPVLVEPVFLLLPVLIELVVRLLPVLAEQFLVVLVEPVFLLPVVVLRELLSVVLLTIILQAVVLLTVVLLAVLLFVSIVAKGTDVDVASKAWHILSPPSASDGLWSSSIRHSVLVQDSLRRPVPGSTLRTGAAIATITQISSVTLTSGIGRPSAISSANGINISTSRAVEPASPIKKSSGAITGDSWAKSRNLFFYSRLVFYATRDVRPGSIVLAKRNIVSTSFANNLA